jgi:hypothetical protein
MYIFFSGYTNPYGLPYSSWQPDRGFFLIDPVTILDSLRSGQKVVFRPYTEQQDGEAPNFAFNGRINWDQGEYLMVVDALNQFVWKDKLSDWKIYEMTFLLGCRENPSGFENGSFTFFKTKINDNGKKVYTVRDFFVEPEYMYVEWRSGADYPRPLLGWRSINLDNLKINALEALKTAEENGGRNTRLKFSNNCMIQISLAPHLHAGWEVSYSIETLPEFTISIDPISGKIIDRR